MLVALLACMIAAAASAAQPPLPDAELLLFLAEFADEQGDLTDPAFLEHARTEWDRGNAQDESADRPAHAQESIDHEPAAADARAGAASGDASRAQRAEKHDD